MTAFLPKLLSFRCHIIQRQNHCMYICFLQDIQRLFRLWSCLHLSLNSISPDLLQQDRLTFNSYYGCYQQDYYCQKQYRSYYAFNLFVFFVFFSFHIFTRFRKRDALIIKRPFRIFSDTCLFVFRVKNLSIARISADSFLTVLLYSDNMIYVLYQVFLST